MGIKFLLIWFFKSELKRKTREILDYNFLIEYSLVDPRGEDKWEQVKGCWWINEEEGEDEKQDRINLILWMQERCEGDWLCDKWEETMNIWTTNDFVCLFDWEELWENRLIFPGMIRGERENEENIYFDERECDKGQMIWWVW